MCSAGNGKHILLSTSKQELRDLPDASQTRSLSRHRCTLRNAKTGYPRHAAFFVSFAAFQRISCRVEVGSDLFPESVPSPRWNMWSEQAASRGFICPAPLIRSSGLLRGTVVLAFICAPCLKSPAACQRSPTCCDQPTGHSFSISYPPEQRQWLTRPFHPANTAQ